MPDTGAPWNIPYVESADLVSDWPADSLLVANAVAAGLSAAGNAGIGSNVVQTAKTDTFSTTSATFTTVTGLTVTITPTSASSKILLLADVKLSHSDAAGGYIVRLAGGNAAAYVGAAVGSRTQGLVGLENASAVAEHIRLLGQTFVYLDSPATTSATTYSVEIVQTRTGTAYVNQTGLDTNSADFPRGASSITAIEVAA